MSVVFDKLSFMRHLESDGTFPRPQAEKLSEALHQAIQETVATKADVERLEARVEAMDLRLDAKLSGVDAKMASLEARLGGRMDSLEARLDSRIDSLEARMDASIASLKVWFAGGLVALFSALSAIRFFAH